MRHQALEQARLNAEQLGLIDRCRFLASDLFAEVPPGSLFDLIVSNPPYVADDELAATPPDVHAYEPHAALLGGPAGSTSTIASCRPRRSSLRPAAFWRSRSPSSAPPR